MTVRLSFAFAKRYGILLQPSTEAFGPERVRLSVRQDTPESALFEVRRCVGKPVDVDVLSDEAFEQALITVYETGSDETEYLAGNINEELDLYRLARELPETQDLLEQSDDAPIIRLINALLSQAIKEQASDIHLETFESNVVIRFRIDGILRKVLEPDRLLAPLMVSRIKVMARLDIAEKRLPQDGRMALKIGGRLVDVRVSTLPSNHGERVVLRLLDKQAGRLDLNRVGMSASVLSRMREAIREPHGIILVTGPTGSGKTTTLYAALSELNDASRNILTVEDPIEYELPGIGQTQVSTKVDLTFAKGLRAILRQDPDVVMVGEIRDQETAQVAVQASLTGHLVFSTLHTNSALGAFSRLRDMGVEPFLLASSLVAVLAQRLVRVLCSRCKKSLPVDRKEAELLGEPEGTLLYRAVGCEHCHGTGYLGRTGIYELIKVDAPLRGLIHEGLSEKLMESHARAQGSSMRQDGLDRVKAGITTVEEVLRVTSERGMAEEEPV